MLDCAYDYREIITMYCNKYLPNVEIASYD